MIAPYRGVYAAGTLTHVDGVTRLPRETAFEITPEGHFRIEVDVVQPVLGGAHLDVEGSYVPVLLLPGSTTTVTLGPGGPTFSGESAATQRNLAAYRSAAERELNGAARVRDAIHGGTLPGADALAAFERFADERRAHLATFVEEHETAPLLQEALLSEITYEAAHSAICFRYSSVLGRRSPRAGLQERFVDTVLERYPLDARGGLLSRRYLDYVANVVEVLEERANESVEDRIDAYRTLGGFTEAELQLIEGIYLNDRATFESEAFAAFDTPENRRREFSARKRFRLQGVLEGAGGLTPNEGRDRVVAQAVAKHYLAGDLIAPTRADWARIDGLIGSLPIRAHLRDEFARRTAVATPATIAEASPPASTHDVDALLRSARGKVVYIDFWATWCAPCRAEFPASRRLARAFEDEDVVFLGLCAQSDRAEWQRAIEQHGLDGIQVFLSDEDYARLAGRYGVRGFPTYVLIDRTGDVSDANAPRPSTGGEAVEAIRALLGG
ncbi:MAG: TlpA disulfide reductase family protein [Planctomycetota bacterium]